MKNKKTTFAYNQGYEDGFYNRKPNAIYAVDAELEERNQYCKGYAEGQNTRPRNESVTSKGKEYLTKVHREMCSEAKHILDVVSAYRDMQEIAGFGLNLNFIVLVLKNMAFHAPNTSNYDPEQEIEAFKAGLNVLSLISKNPDQDPLMQYILHNLRGYIGLAHQIVSYEEEEELKERLKERDEMTDEMIKTIYSGLF